MSEGYYDTADIHDLEWCSCGARCHLNAKALTKELTSLRARLRPTAENLEFFQRFVSTEHQARLLCTAIAARAGIT